MCIRDRAAVVAIVLVLKKPDTVAQPKSSAGIVANGPSLDAQSSNQKVDQLEPAARPSQVAQPSQSGGGYAAGTQASQISQTQQSSKPEAHPNSDGISALLAQAAGAAGSAGAGGFSPESEVGSGEPNIKDQQVTYEGDVVHGRFLTEIAGKDVWVTISGHMGSKDGYATFEPTEFKVGDMDVPVSLVNPALQRKLAEERNRLKLPN